MTIVINLGLHGGGRIGSIFITGIFGNFYTKRGRFLTSKTGIPGGLGFITASVSYCQIGLLLGSYSPRLEVHIALVRWDI